MSKVDLLIEAQPTIDNNDSRLERIRVWPEHRVQKGKQSGSDAGECTLCEVVYVARKFMQDGKSLLPKKNSRSVNKIVCQER